MAYIQSLCSLHYRLIIWGIHNAGGSVKYDWSSNLTAGFPDGFPLLNMDSNQVFMIELFIQMVWRPGLQSNRLHDTANFQLRKKRKM